MKMEFAAGKYWRLEHAPDASMAAKAERMLAPVRVERTRSFRNNGF
jgi:hypothetical protein